MTPVDCWNTIGIRGDGSCPELARLAHCQNCPVYVTAAQSASRSRSPRWIQRRRYCAFRQAATCRAAFHGVGRHLQPRIGVAGAADIGGGRNRSPEADPLAASTARPYRRRCECARRACCLCVAGPHAGRGRSGRVGPQGPTEWPFADPRDSARRRPRRVSCG